MEHEHVTETKETTVEKRVVHETVPEPPPPKGDTVIIETVHTES